MEYDQLKIENQLCFPLYSCSRLVVRKYTPFLEKIGLTYTQYIVMMVLWEEKTINVKTLGKRLFLDSGTLSPLLKALEGKKLIRKERLESDERVVMISLTSQGLQLREEAKDIPFNMRKDLILTDEEAAVMYRLLYRILENEEKLS